MLHSLLVLAAHAAPAADSEVAAMESRIEWVRALVARQEDVPAAEAVGQTLDALETLPAPERDATMLLALGAVLDTTWGPYAACGIEWHRGRPRYGGRFDRCLARCDIDTLHDLGGPWYVAGEPALLPRIEAACASSPGLASVPASARPALTPVELLGAVVVLDQAQIVLGTDTRGQARLRKLGAEAARTAPQRRTAALLPDLANITAAIANADPTQKSMLILHGLAEVGEEAGRYTPGRYSFGGESAQLASADVLDDVGCVPPDEAVAFAAQLATLPAEEATRRLLARCDAAGPDPVFGPPVEGPLQRAFTSMGSWRDPATVRGQLWWFDYVLFRSVATPVLGMLDAYGTAEARDLAADVRASVLFFPERPNLRAEVDALLSGGDPSEGLARPLFRLAVRARFVVDRWENTALFDEDPDPSSLHVLSTTLGAGCLPPEGRDFGAAPDAVFPTTEEFARACDAYGPDPVFRGPEALPARLRLPWREYWALRAGAGPLLAALDAGEPADRETATRLRARIMADAAAR